MAPLRAQTLWGRTSGPAVGGDSVWAGRPAGMRPVLGQGVTSGEPEAGQGLREAGPMGRDGRVNRLSPLRPASGHMHVPPWQTGGLQGTATLQHRSRTVW